MSGPFAGSQWYGGPPIALQELRTTHPRRSGTITGAPRNQRTPRPVVRSADEDGSKGSSTGRGRARDHAAVRIIAEAPQLTRSDRITLLRGAVVAAMLVGVGLLLGWVIVATPIIASMMPGLRPTAVQVATAILAWAFAIVVPAGLVIMGVARAVTAIELLQTLRPTAQGPRLAGKLDDRFYVATSLRLPDGRYIHEVVLGPFGIAILGDTPPRDLSRVIGGHWELRNTRRGWSPIENPVERTVRDAERLRRWLGGEDRDFVVKIYAALVTDDPRVERTPACTILTGDQVPGWLEGLPAQRGLTAGRHEELVELIRSVAPIGR